VADLPTVSSPPQPDSASISEPPCPVCAADTAPFDAAVVLNTHEVQYHRCLGCALVFIADVPWLEEAYESAIHDADVGLLRRARRYSALASAVIRSEGLRGGRFLDWAGGYGVLTQVMRDRGFDYWQHDDYATPVFARGFQDEGVGRYDLISAFEVVEHLADPVESLAPIAARTDHFFFTTELLPDPPPRISDWWYYMPEVGQHITFHTEESLRELGRRLGFELTSNGRNWHLFHRRAVRPRTRVILSARLNRTARAARGAGGKLRGRR